MPIDKSKIPQVPTPKSCNIREGPLEAPGTKRSSPSSQKSIKSLKSNAKLTLREKQIVKLVQQGKSNKEIAFELCLTVGTVKEYIHHIFRKLGMTNRTELAVWGIEYESEVAS
jgi:DNA-binding NarL/FixJ family response regulator